MVWRTAIVLVGAIGTVVLWQNDTLRDDAQRNALRTAIEQANKHSDEHAEKQTEKLTSNLNNATLHSDEQIATVNKNLGTTTSSVLDAFSKTAEELNKKIEAVKPPPTEKAKMVFSFWVEKSDQFPALIRTFHPDKETNIVDLDLTFRNVSKVTAKDVEIWLQVCDDCSYSKEMPGFEKLSGSADQIRHRRIGDIHGGVFFEKISASVIVKPTFSSFVVSFAYGCDNCESNLLAEDSQKQALTVVVLR